MRSKRFTLIEVLIALSVLCLGILAATQLLSSAQTRSLRAQKEWREQHLLSLAADFYMLTSPDTPLPEAVFPDRDYRVTAEYLPGGAVLPNGVSDRNGEWRFVVLRLQLFNAVGELVRTLEINQILEARQL